MDRVNHNKAFQALLEVNMGTRVGERVLVFSDQIRPDEIVTDGDRHRRIRLYDTAVQCASFARGMCGNAEFVGFPATPASGAEPPLCLWHALFGEAIITRFSAEDLLEPLLTKRIDVTALERAKEIVLAGKQVVADIVIALANNSTSHTNFRKLACHTGARFASLPHFDPDMFDTSMTVDWYALADRTSRLAAALNRAEWIRVECPNGTAMHICKQGRTAEGDDGLLIAPGSFGNLPAGEAYLAPLEGESHGTMVIEWGPTAKLSSPLTLTIAEGKVVRIDGDDPLRQRLEAKFAENTNCRNLAELGVGTNDKASRPDNVLEAEKILGTIHLALGDNTGFGGTVAAPFHEDYVFYQPTVTLELADGTEEVILDNGQLQL